jgi:hypothetical protein
MLHPARLREELLKFPLRNRPRLPFAIKENGTRAGGTLIKRKEVFHREETTTPLARQDLNLN